MKRWLLLSSLALASLGAEAQTPQRGIPLTDLKSGTTFMSADLRTLQTDDGLNPASLWWLQGEHLWQQPTPEGPACASCHGDAASRMAGVAARYPRVTPAGAVLNLEAQKIFPTGHQLSGGGRKHRARGHARGQRQQRPTARRGGKL